jgi:hypothetical protein
MKTKIVCSTTQFHNLAVLTNLNEFPSVRFHEDTMYYDEDDLIFVHDFVWSLSIKIQHCHHHARTPNLPLILIDHCFS